MDQQIRNLLWFLGAMFATIALGTSSVMAQTPGDAAAYWGRVGPLGSNTVYNGVGDQAGVYRRGAWNTAVPLRQQMPTPTITPSSGGPVATALRKLPVKGPGGVANIVENVKLTPTTFSPAARHFARAYPLAMIGLAAYSYFQDDDIRYDQAEEEWVRDVPGPVIGNASVVKPGASPGSTSYQNITLATFDQLQRDALLTSPQRAQCLQFNNQACVRDNTPTQLSLTGPCTLNGKTGSNYTMRTENNTSKGSHCGVPGPPETQPVNDNDMEEAWRNGNGQSTTDPQAEVALAREVVAKNTPIDLSQAPTTLELPSSPITSAPQTTTRITANPDGSTTSRTVETVQVTNIINNTERTQTFSEQRIETRIIERIITRDENNTIIDQEDREQARPEVPDEDPEPETEEEEQEEDLTFTDPAFGAVPTLYEQKYPDGLMGVWQAKSADLMGSQFVESVQGMFPSLGSGGACPSWSMPLNFGVINFGNADVSVPCWIWDVVGLILLITATFVARRIVFGG